MVQNSVDYRDCTAYLQGIKTKKPFNCPNLRVLPRDLTVNVNGTLDTYSKGALLCLGKFGRIRTSYECRMNYLRILELNKKGNLEIACDLNGSKLEVIVKNFEFKKREI